VLKPNIVPDGPVISQVDSKPGESSWVLMMISSFLGMRIRKKIARPML
jgi:hypothetical protein